MRISTLFLSSTLDDVMMLMLAARKALLMLLCSLGLMLPVLLASAKNNSSDKPSSRSGTNSVTHWAFVPPKSPAIPKTRNQHWVRNPIDAFILSRLEQDHLKPSPPADPVTLIRRLYLDLLGLPPTTEDVQAFLKSQSGDAYEVLVERLLASPHFGERWGRHWLDLARYADSSGYQVDRERPYAYLYRDWVINAVNRDLPFDQFTIEQLAGDLLPKAAIDQKIAAGFHRHTLMNHEDGVDPAEFRAKAKVDRVATTGTAWLGLTLGCAECHSHKYDPITQREFYSLYAFFNSAEEADVSAPQPSDKGAQAQTFVESSTPVKTFVHIRGDFLRKGAEVTPGVLSAVGPPEPFAAPEPTSLSSSAPTNSGGAALVPVPRSPNRLDLARWVADRSNPLTSRVAVNRFWQHLFGRGLVNTPGDFGLRGEAPSHPELLDWLATEFMARNWSRKAMIKLIVTSNTYRQSSRSRAELFDRDPLNVLVAHQNRYRLECEIIRDLYLSAGGLLNPQIGGPSCRPPTTDDFKHLSSAGAFNWVDSEGPAKYRRGLYVFGQRTVPYPVWTTFDEANPSESCPRREQSCTPLQALSLLNNPMYTECAEGLARRISTHQARSPREKLEWAFEACLARKPAQPELARLTKLYEDERLLASKTRRVEISKSTNAASVSLVNTQKTEQAQTGTNSTNSTNITTALPPLDPADASACFAVAQVLMNLEEFITRE